MAEVIQIKSARPGRGGARAGSGRKPGSATKNPGRFIYVLHEENDASVCKIGMANNPYSRLSGHQVSTWRRLMLAGVFTAPSSGEAALIEKAVHRALSGTHVLGEWFRVSPEKAIAEVIAIAKTSAIVLEPFAIGHLKEIKI
jgi:hypothetical protein